VIEREAGISHPLNLQLSMTISSDQHTDATMDLLVLLNTRLTIRSTNCRCQHPRRQLWLIVSEVKATSSISSTHSQYCEVKGNMCNKIRWVATCESLEACHGAKDPGVERLRVESGYHLPRMGEEEEEGWDLAGMDQGCPGPLSNVLLQTMVTSSPVELKLIIMTSFPTQAFDDLRATHRVDITSVKAPGSHCARYSTYPPHCLQHCDVVDVVVV
jgi:hypothetical protein